MKGPTIHSSEYEFVGIAFPWYVFKPTREKLVPERRYVACANYINDDLVGTNECARTYYKPLLPFSSYPK